MTWRALRASATALRMVAMAVGESVWLPFSVKTMNSLFDGTAADARSCADATPAVPIKRLPAKRARVYFRIGSPPSVSNRTDGRRTRQKLGVFVEFYQLPT